MFTNRLFRCLGFRNMSIGFVGREAGIATVMYSHELNETEKQKMASRIVAALNLTRNIPLVVLEKADPLPAPEAMTGVFADQQRREVTQLLSRFRDGLISDVDVADAIGTMSYRNGLRDAPPRNGKQAAWMCPENPSAQHAFTWATAACEALPALSCSCCGKPKIRVWVSTGF